MNHENTVFLRSCLCWLLEPDDIIEEISEEIIKPLIVERVDVVDEVVSSQIIQEKENEGDAEGLAHIFLPDKQEGIKNSGILFFTTFQFPSLKTTKSARQREVEYVVQYPYF